MSTPKFWMRLQESEDFADASCGCILQRSRFGGVPEILQCSLHRAAPKMLEALKAALYELAGDGSKPTPDPIPMIKKAIAKATR